VCFRFETLIARFIFHASNQNKLNNFASAKMHILVAVLLNAVGNIYLRKKVSRRLVRSNTGAVAKPSFILLPLRKNVTSNQRATNIYRPALRPPQ
jgi:hypothetical protein